MTTMLSAPAAPPPPPSLPAESFFITGGTLRYDAPSYIPRRADDDLYDGLRAGRFCYVLNTRQMGKSSLMVRTAARLRADGVAVVVLDLTSVGQNLSLDQWYDGLLARLGEQLDLDDEIEGFWHETAARLGPLQRWTEAIRQVALPRCPHGLVVFVDEIDAVRSLPFSTDEFFAGIRACYNARTDDPAWNRLTFCLLGVATPADLIRDTRTTPFNIGQRIDLGDFTPAEAAILAPHLGTSGDALLARALHWTGGHPYLTQRLCRAIAEDPDARAPGDVDRLCRALFLSSRAREQDDNLLFVRERLLRDPSVDTAAALNLYAQVLAGRRRVTDDPADPLISTLWLSGVTRVKEGRLRVRNRIYREVFDRDWVRTNMPDAELRRQRAAFRRGLVRTAAVAGVLIAGVGALAVTAAQSEGRARRYASILKSALDRSKELSADLKNALSDAQERRLQAEEARKKERKQKALAEKESEKARASAAEARQNAQAANKSQGKAEEAAALAEAEKARADKQRERADEQAGRAKRLADAETRSRARAENESQRSRTLLYAAHMNLAQQAWEQNNVARTLALLRGQIPAKGQRDPRGWEWRYLWRLCQGNTPRAFRPGSGAQTTLALSADGRTLAFAEPEGGVRVWNVAEQRDVETFGKRRAIEAVAVSPSGRYVAAADSDKNVRVWNVSQKREVATIGTLHADKITALTLWERDERVLLATGSVDKTAKIWDVHPRQLLKNLEGHSEPVTAVAFSRDGKRAATGSEDNTVKLWDLEGRGVSTLKGHGGDVLCLDFDPDGKRLASAGFDQIVRVWDVAGEDLISRLPGHTGTILSVAFSPDGRTLASGDVGGAAKLWDVATEQERDTKQEGAPVALVAFEGRDTLVTGSGDTSLKLWDIDAEDVTRLRGHQNVVSSLAFSPDGRWLATGSADRTVRLWDAHDPGDGRALGTLETSLASVAFSPDSRTLAACGRDGLVTLWGIDAANGSRPPAPATLKGHRGAVSGVAFVPPTPGEKASLLASAGADGTARLWDVRARRVVATFAAPRGVALESVAASPDGKLLAAGDRDGVVRVWDLVTRSAVPRFTLTAAARRVSIDALAFAPDGRMLASGGADNRVRLWDVATGRPRATLSAHGSPVTSVAFSPDNKTLASGSRDNTVKLWNTATNQEVITFRGDAGVVFSVAFSPGGDTLAAGGSDMTARLWRAALPPSAKASPPTTRTARR